VASTPPDNQNDAFKDQDAVTGRPDRPAGPPAQGSSPGWTPPAATGAGQPTAPGPGPGGGGGYQAPGTPAGYPAPGAPAGYPPQGAPSGYPAQQTPGGYPAQQTPGGYPAQQTPGGYPPPGTPAGYPAQQTPGGYPLPGTPAGYPAQGWSPPGYARPPVGRKPGFGLRLTGMLLAIAGALGIIVACLLPFGYFQQSGGGQSSSSILNAGPPDALLWFAAEPVVVALVALVAGIVLLVSRSQGVRWAMAGVLLAFGIQTALLFLGYLLGYSVGSGSHHGPGGPVGIFAGLLLLAAGIIGLAGAAAGQRAAGQQGGTTAAIPA
jgi:hypothetical protein